MRSLPASEYTAEEGISALRGYLHSHAHGRIGHKCQDTASTGVMDEEHVVHIHSGDQPVEISKKGGYWEMDGLAGWEWLSTRCQRKVLWCVSHSRLALTNTTVTKLSN